MTCNHDANFNSRPNSYTVSDIKCSQIRTIRLKFAILKYPTNSQATR